MRWSRGPIFLRCRSESGELKRVLGKKTLENEILRETPAEDLFLEGGRES